MLYWYYCSHAIHTVCVAGVARALLDAHVFVVEISSKSLDGFTGIIQCDQICLVTETNGAGTIVSLPRQRDVIVLLKRK